MAKPGVWVPAFIGLGSNLDDPLVQVQAAAHALARLTETRLMKTSPWYRNPAMGPAGQPDYVNGVLALLTRLEPRRLLDALKAQEGDQGRTPVAERWGPRRIDLDLLLFGERRIDESDLRVPHPGLAERAFVLGPLADIAPDVWVPGLGRVAKLVKVCDLSPLKRIETQA